MTPDAASHPAGRFISGGLLAPDAAPDGAACSRSLRYTGSGPAAGTSSLSSNIIKFRKPTAAEKAKGKTLCREGFHKWTIRQDKQFDVKQGRLVTVYSCVRCGAIKTEAR